MIRLEWKTIAVRSAPLFALIASLFGCSTERVVTPREYLDEQTAATITVVKDPWIFTRESARTADSQYRDFLHLYAIDVNRMGDHRQYIAALQSFSAEQRLQTHEPPTLELRTGEWSITLRASAAQPKEIGIVQPVAEAYTLNASWWYFPVDKQTLASIANTTDLQATMLHREERVAYTLWRDGREELSELTAVLP
jgi:hypothetical protein